MVCPVAKPGHCEECGSARPRSAVEETSLEARISLAERRLALAVERLRSNAEVGCYGNIRKAMCQPHDKCSACRSRATLEQIARLR